MHIIAPSFPIVKVGIKNFSKNFLKKETACRCCLCKAVFLFLHTPGWVPSLQMLIPWDPVVPLKQQRLYHRGKLHVEIEEVNRECDYEECESSGQQIK